MLRTIARNLAAWAIFVCSLVAVPTCLGQSYKTGENVEVFYLNSWHPGVVVSSSPRGIVVEYSFANRPRRELFKGEAVRAEFESGAMARGRLWSDTSGSFKVKAALLAINDDTVTLRKQDLSEITVPISKLSEGDRSFLTKLQKSMGLAGERGPQPPEPESFSLGLDFGAGSFGTIEGRPAIQPDPIPAYLKLKQGGCGFAAEDFFDRLGTVLPVGASDQWLLAAVENEKPSEAFPTRLYWVSLARQKVEKRQLLPPSEKLLDYHATSHRVLTYNEIRDVGDPWGKGTLTVWETTPTDAKVKPIARWYVEGNVRKGNDPWGRLIDGNLVLQRADRQRYVVWDVSAKAARYQISQESFFAPELVLSGGRNQLIVPEDKAVRVLEAATGKWLTSLPAKDGASSVAVSEDGRQAAVLGRSTLSVWDLTTADAEPKVYQAEAIGTPFTATIAWVGNERIMADSHNDQVLFSLKNNLTLWRYDFDHNAISEHWGSRVREIVDQHLVYAATFGDARQRGLAVGAVKLPGPRVDETEAKLQRDLLYIVKPGTPVAVQVNAGEHTERVTKALEAKVTANGWTLSPTAGAVLVAEMKQGESQTVNYRMMGFGRPESTQSATFVPYIATLKLQVGEATAWSTGTSSGAPPVVRLKEGETAQAEVDKWQKPHPEFFDGVKIPDRILDPKYRNGLGTTMVTNRGLIPKD